MAAELAAGSRGATASSDVFSFAVIATEALTGRRPFVGNVVDLAVAGAPLPTARSLAITCPALAPEVAALLDRGLLHEPSARPTAVELHTALVRSISAAHDA